MKGAWKKLATKLVFKSRFMKIRQDTVELPDGKTREWVYWDSSDSVMVVGATRSNKLIMIRQYRYLAGSEVIEFPAGYIEDGEAPEEAAGREFHEETGQKTEKFISLGAFYETYGQLNRRIHLFFAPHSTQGNKRLDKGKRGVEDIRETVEVEFDEVVQMVRENTINSSPTSLAVLLLQEKMRKKEIKF